MAVVPSVADFRKAITKEAIEDLQIEYEGKVTSPARVSVRFEEAPAQGQTIFEYDAGGRGAKDYQRIATEITHRLQAQQTSNKAERKA